MNQIKKIADELQGNFPDLKIKINYFGVIVMQENSLYSVRLKIRNENLNIFIYTTFNWGFLTFLFDRNLKKKVNSKVEQIQKFLLVHGYSYSNVQK